MVGSNGVLPGEAIRSVSVETISGALKSAALPAPDCGDELLPTGALLAGVLADQRVRRAASSIARVVRVAMPLPTSAPSATSAGKWTPVWTRE